MPIYEFACAKCGREFEEIAFGDEVAPCPHCGSHDTHKLMSACCRRRSGSSGASDYAPASPSSGCAGCSGGNCASCGH